MEWSPPNEVKTALLRLARKTLEFSFSQREEKALDEFTKSNVFSFPEVSAPFSCFVALYENKKRRGCIGGLDSETPLYIKIQGYTLQAAFHDPRFERLKQREITNVKIRISVLGPEKALENPSQIEIGKHGVLIIHKEKHAIMLAHTAVENGWEGSRLLSETCQKAELDPIRLDEYETYFFEEHTFEET